MTRRRLALIFVPVLVAGCWQAPGAGVRVVSSRPQAVTPTLAGSCADPLASLKPLDPLPAPGALSSDPGVRAIQDRGSLVAGISADSPRMGYWGPESDQPQGFEIDLLRLISMAMFGDRDHVTYRVINASQSVPLLESGAVDLVARHLELSCQNQGQIDLSSEYYHAYQVFLVARDSGVRNVWDLLGKRVCVPAGSIWLENVRNSPSHLIPVAVTNPNDCLVAFQEGEVDAISMDQASLCGFMEQDPYARIVDPVASGAIGEGAFAIGVGPSNPDLVRFVNSVLERARQDGTWTSSYSRWFGRYLPPAEPPPARYLG